MHWFRYGLQTTLLVLLLVAVAFGDDRAGKGGKNGGVTATQLTVKGKLPTIHKHKTKFSEYEEYDRSVIQKIRAVHLHAATVYCATLRPRLGSSVFPPKSYLHFS